MKVTGLVSRSTAPETLQAELPKTAAEAAPAGALKLPRAWSAGAASGGGQQGAARLSGPEPAAPALPGAWAPWWPA